MLKTLDRQPFRVGRPVRPRLPEWARFGVFVSTCLVVLAALCLAFSLYRALRFDFGGHTLAFGRVTMYQPASGPPYAIGAGAEILEYDLAAIEGGIPRIALYWRIPFSGRGDPYAYSYETYQVVVR